MAQDLELARIDAAMKAQHKSRADLGRLLGLDSAQVHRLFNGKRRLQLHEARLIDEWLGSDATSGRAAVGTVAALPGLVPLYGWTGDTSAARLPIDDSNLRGYVPMHPAQSHVRDAFALEVYDLAMSPRYEPGETVFVVPNRWPRRGQDCVVVTTTGEGLLRRFVRRDDQGVILESLSPAEEVEIPAADVRSIHAVVGRG